MADASDPVGLAFTGGATQSGDTELAEFFAKAQADSRKGAELAKGLLRARLG